MLGVRLEFAQFGHFDSFSVCRSLSPMNPNSLPIPIATNLKTMFYFDSDVHDVLDMDLYYRVIVHRGDEVLVSDESSVYISSFSAPYGVHVSFNADDIHINTEWECDGIPTQQIYYCAVTEFTAATKPPPKAVLLGDVRTYLDTDIEVGKTYYLAIGSVRNAIEKLSNVVSISTNLILPDPLWASVRALIYAEAENYPSTEFINQKVSGASISASSGVSIINTVPPIYDEGVIYFNGNNSTITIDYAPVRNPYTQEAFVRIPKNPTTSNWYARIFNEHVGISSDAGSKNNFRLIIDGNLQGPSSYIPDETNTHVCLMCGNGIARFYVDGVKVHESAYFGNVNGQVFGGGTAGQQFNGYMSGLRCTPGFRYDLNGFTPPNHKLPNF